VQISGSALIYELDDLRPVTGVPVPELEAEFPGIRRLIHEHHLRYTFVRFGVPYVVSVGCFDAGVPRYRMPTCRSADRIAARFLRALRVAGGTPQRLPAPELPPIARPEAVSPSFTYRPPGRLLAGTGFRGQDGRADTTVYSQIRFPLAQAPAFVNSQMFQSRNKPVVPGQSANYSYPWRDNFCERRGFPVGQCPAGAGHQGQDIRKEPCAPGPGENRCRPNYEIVAVRDGAVLRAPKQEALYLVVNTAREHLRFRYLHMHPAQMDADNLFSGRRVEEGETLGRVSNFNKREGGTSYHLHFDVQIPTRHGWVFVNPYMTLVAAYERLIGGRGERFTEPAIVASTDPTATAVLVTAERAEPKVSKPTRKAKRTAYRSGKRKFGGHYAGRHKKYARHRSYRN
jgi:murein DD-endopeptidase MepM/ murein hydrolase activator NlpD